MFDCVRVLLSLLEWKGKGESAVYWGRERQPVTSSTSSTRPSLPLRLLESAHNHPHTPCLPAFLPPHPLLPWPPRPGHTPDYEALYRRAKFCLAPHGAGGDLEAEGGVPWPGSGGRGRWRQAARARVALKRLFDGGEGTGVRAGRLAGGSGMHRAAGGWAQQGWGWHVGG